MRMASTKDVLRKYIEIKLPGLRKTSLKKEVEILEEFVEKKKENPKGAIYSRNLSSRIENVGYHLEKLSEAGAIKSSYIEPVKVVVDLAEENPAKRTKRGSKQIRKARELRVSRLVEHATEEAAVFSVVCAVLSVNSIEAAEAKISFSHNFGEERERFRNYNKIVDAIKKEEIEPIEYDFLLWRNAAKPWKLTDDFVYHLRDKGINMEG